MKKSLLFLIILLSSHICSAQIATTCDTSKFTCHAIFDDIAKFNRLYVQYKNASNNQEWANVLKKDFPLDHDGIIHFTYIIKCDTTFDISEVNAISSKWYGQAFSSDAAIKINTEDMISGTGTYYSIGQITIPAIVYHKIIRMNASTDIVLRFKENRIKMDITCRHYTYISGDSFGHSKSTLVSPDEAFPFRDTQSNADRAVYAQAYINCCSFSLEHAIDYLKFINQNFNIVAEDEDW